MNKVQAKTIVRDKEGHYTMMKGSILYEEMTTLSMYLFNNRASIYVSQKLTELK